MRFFGIRKNPFFVALWKSNYSEKEKIEYSCLTEKAISRTSKNIAFSWFSENWFFGNRKNRYFVANWRSDFSEREKIDFSWRTEKAIFPIPKKIAFSWRQEQAIFRNQKKWVSLGELKKRLFGNRLNRFFMAPWNSDYSETDEIDFFLAPWKTDPSGNEKNGFFVAHSKSYFPKPKNNFCVLNKRFFWNGKNWFFMAPNKPKKWLSRAHLKSDSSET